MAIRGDAGSARALLKMFLSISKSVQFNFCKEAVNPIQLGVGDPPALIADIELTQSQLQPSVLEQALLTGSTGRRLQMTNRTFVTLNMSGR